MIFTEKKITINNNQCKIDSPVVLYRGDYNVEVRFTIVSSPYKYSNKQETNVIEQTEASYGQLVIKTPGDKAPIFSEITATKRGAITFTITAEMIDEVDEIGNYTFQIRLLDENKESRATIPEVVNGIEIREPIATEDVSTTNEVGVATVGYALTTAGTTEDTFDSQGNYNKTTWATGDRITAAKLDKIEAGIDGVNKKVASGGTGVNNINDSTASSVTTYSGNKIENIKEHLSSQIKEKASKSELETQKARIDSFTSLPEGSTTGDAELIDGRIGTDGLIYNNIGSAIRTQIRRLSDVLEKYVYSDNTIDYTYNENLIIELGQEIVAEKWNTTDFIPVKLGNLYTVKDKASRVNYYGINKNYISSGSNDVTSFTPPDNTYFVRLSWYSGDFPKLVLIDGVEENQKLSLLQANAGNITIQTGKNKFNKYNLLEGKNYITVDGNIVTTQYDIYVSKPFPIVRFGDEKYVTLSTTGILKDNIGYLFLDKNSNVIDHGMYNNSSSQTIEIPINAKYMQVTYNCITGEETSNLQVEYGKTATTFENYKSEFSVEEINEIVDSVIKSNSIRKVVEIKPTSDIMDFYNSMVAAYNEGNCDVYIRSGNYTYTNEMIDFIRSEDKRGVPIGNNCKYYFDSNAYIYCEYTGDNAQDIGSFFSPLDSCNTSGSWALHNLNLISKNTHIYMITVQLY